MRVYCVTNGWMGASFVRCYVIAKNDVEAIKKAEKKFKEKSKKIYDSNYYKNLEAELLLDEENDISEITDE
jgi:hypothetical protein